VTAGADVVSMQPAEEFAGRVVHAGGGEREPVMILRTIAFNTFGMFLRDKILIVVAILFTCGLLLMLTPCWPRKQWRAWEIPRSPVDGAGNCVSDFDFHEWIWKPVGAWTAAIRCDGMKSGTILAVMARPVKRWQFLLGKFSA